MTAPAGRIRARAGLIACRRAASSAGSAASRASALAVPSRVRTRRDRPNRMTLMRFDAVPPTATISRGRASGRLVDESARLDQHLDHLLGRRRVVRGEPLGQAGRAQAQPGRARRTVGPDDAELRAAAAQVHDQRLVGDRPALHDADDRQEGLLLVGEHVQRQPERRPRPRGRASGRRRPGGAARSRPA